MFYRQDSMDIPPLDLNIGAHWKQLRIEQGVTIERLAYQMDCSEKMIQRIETNKKVPDIVQLAVASVLYGRSLPFMYPAHFFEMVHRYIAWEQPFDLAEAIRTLRHNGAP